MPDDPQEKALKDLQRIPGVGKAIAQDLWGLGFRSAGELKGQDPETLFRKVSVTRKAASDPCMLYTLRCAVYWASHTEHDPKLLKWWNWKDK